jgi:hypothetical protein
MAKKLAPRKEREDRIEKLYSAFSAKEKRKYFGGTITKERRGKSASAAAIEDRIDQEKKLRKDAGLRRGGK